ncbi:type II toxin-antitoxin system HipA family toxin [Pigmentiphaga litoralis]|uniref:type II toxin-antitoxin system HipA family toxin n=1 Tax=Pigmentiphaga litoralis TaxID=516702 RepID=UPI003B43CCB4
MARNRKLMVFAHLDEAWAPCGQLSMTEEGSELLASSFAYGTRYVARSNAIEVDPVSLPLRHGESPQGNRLFPANALVAFGGIRDAAPDAWGRRVIEAKHRQPANSLPESTYLLEAGSERVGALDVRESIASPPSPSVSHTHQLAYLLEAAERIEQGLPVPNALEMIFDHGSGLGGARPKATVRDAAGRLAMAKFPSAGDPFDIPAIESASLLLARQVGLDVPDVCTSLVGNRRVMMIRRFDRYWLEQGQVPGPVTSLSLDPGPGKTERRRAFVSGLTMVGCDETESRQKSYSDLAQAIRRYCHPSVIRADNEELYMRMVFNIFVTNDDDHLRNHGFLWDPRIKGWRLSPLYDVLPRPTHAQERQLHLGVGPQGRHASIDNAIAGCGVFTLNARRAGELVAKVWSEVREWKVHFERFGVSAQDIERISPAFRHLDDVTTRATRLTLE